MAQKKLFRFAQIKGFKNVLEYPQDIAGRWHTFFKNNHPIVLELACGRGEYTVALAKMHPAKNFIGADIKGNRMFIGAKAALDEKISNAGFLRTQIELLDKYFVKDEVDEIWITFPDPQLRASKAKKRLTHPRFLKLYHAILKPGGYIHLKTDSPQLYNFTMAIIKIYGCRLFEHNDNAYAKDNILPELSIRTHYEKMDISRSNRIHYIRFALPDVLPNRDEELKQWIDENTPTN